MCSRFNSCLIFIPPNVNLLQVRGAGMLVIWTDCSFVAGARCRDACNMDGLRQGGGKHWHGGNSILGGDVQKKYNGNVLKLSRIYGCKYNYYLCMKEWR